MSTLMIILAILAVLLTAASLATVITLWRLLNMDIKEDKQDEKFYCIDLGASTKRWFNVTGGEIRDGNKMLLTRDEYAELRCLLGKMGIKEEEACVHGNN